MLFRLYLYISLLSVCSLAGQVVKDASVTQSLDKTNGLSKVGKNVCTYTETITKQVNVTYSSQRWTTISYQTCSWFSCTTKTRLGTKSVTSSRMMTKYFDRDVYYCCNGWQRADDQTTSCETPICPFGCQNGGKCVGPSKCKCLPGFTGKFCQIDTNECSKPLINKCEQVCTDKPGGVSCSCKRGFTLNADGQTCSDIDECQQASSPCGCVATDSNCKALCTNNLGSYQCACPTGYRLNSAELCEDINECYLDQTLCDHKCVNKPGSYQCQCFPGFHYNAATKKCEDINECLPNKGIGDCSHQCINLNGSYVCTCPSGKYLADSKTCKDVDLKSKSQLICQSSIVGMLTCDGINEKINVTDVFYGRVSEKLCQVGNYKQSSCSLPNAINNFKHCNGMAPCLVMLDNMPDPCPGVEKYVTVSYRCES